MLKKIHSAYKQYLKEDSFDSLKKSLIVTATNILNGKLKTFEKGELIKPLLASAVFLGIFAPVKIKNSYYVDGGSLNNFPFELLRDKCDVIIGVYVNSYNDITIADLKHSHNVVERAFKLKTVKEDLPKFNACDVIIYPTELSNYGTFDKKYLEEIYTIGYDSANRVLSNKELTGKLFSSEVHHN